jgi:hypothetical protein
MRTRLTSQTQQRKQYACLWTYRGSPLTEAVARVLNSDSLSDPTVAPPQSVPRLLAVSDEVVPTANVVAAAPTTRTAAASKLPLSSQLLRASSQGESTTMAPRAAASTLSASPSFLPKASPQGYSTSPGSAPMSPVAIELLPRPSAPPRRAADGSLDVGVLRAAQVSRLLEVCAALTAPAFSASSALRACLCADAEEEHALAVQASSAAQARADLAASSSRLAAEQAVREAQLKAAADRAARETAKERLFAKLQAQPEYARLVAEAMAPAPANTGVPA